MRRTEVIENSGQALECVTFADLYVDPSREWFELSELRFERRKVRGISLDNQEVEVGGVPLSPPTVTQSILRR
jgi:hypothetical protein